MPFMAWLIAKILSVDSPQGISMVLIGCTPGGTTSNLFTYFSRGEVSLSIAMTVVSNVAAFFMMPLLLLLYAPSFTDDSLKISFSNIAGGLVVTLIPVAMGMSVLTKNPPLAKKLEKFASVLGCLFILAAIIAGCLQNQVGTSNCDSVYDDFDLSLYVAER